MNRAVANVVVCLCIGGRMVSSDLSELVKTHTNLDYYCSQNANINSNNTFSTDQLIRFNKLNSFLKYKENWNGYGAKPFSSDFICTIQRVLSKLKVQPEVFPVGDGSIQLEYEGINGSYLEIQIFPTEHAEIFIIDKNGNETESTIEFNSKNINRLVEDFYG